MDAKRACLLIERESQRKLNAKLRTEKEFKAYADERIEWVKNCFEESLLERLSFKFAARKLPFTNDSIIISKLPRLQWPFAPKVKLEFDQIYSGTIMTYGPMQRHTLKFNEELPIAEFVWFVIQKLKL